MPPTNQVVDLDAYRAQVALDRPFTPPAPVAAGPRGAGHPRHSKTSGEP